MNFNYHAIGFLYRTATSYTFLAQITGQSPQICSIYVQNFLVIQIDGEMCSTIILIIHLSFAVWHCERVCARVCAIAPSERTSFMKIHNDLKLP